MNRNELAIKGSTIGIISQIVNLLAKFAVRTFAIRVLGKDVLGLDSVLIDTISMLSLAELGITSAMLYRLYSPIIQKDEVKVNRWMATYRLIYNVIACFVAFLGIIISFSLPLIVKDVEIPWNTIYIAYYLQLAASVSSYLLSYKRVLLNADQKKHLCLIVDLGTTVIFSICKIAVILLFSSYVLYLFMTILQVVLSNVILNCYANKKYPYLQKKSKVNKQDLKLIACDAKEVLANKLAGYVYSSTDNLIISIFLGTGVVGLLSNYKYIAVALKGLVNSAMTTIQPLIGNYLNSNIEKKASYQTLKRYTYVRYVIAGVTTVPFIAVADTFVLIWTGNSEYLMSPTITVFLALDYYISCVYGPLGEYILGMGMFKQGKYATFAGAIVNIVFSLIGVKVWGCNGVLFATVMSQLVIWGWDIYIVLFKYYEDCPSYKWDYLKTQGIYIAVITSATIVNTFITEIIPNNSIWLKFIAGAAVSEAIYVIILVAITWKTEEFSYTKYLIAKIFKKVKNKNN